MTSPYQRRLLWVALGFALSNTNCIHASHGGVAIVPQTEESALAEERAKEQTIVRMIVRTCAMLRSDGLRVRQVARRIGKIIGNDGHFGAVEFRPHNPAFSWGMVTRDSRYKEPSDIEMLVADTAVLSLGVLRASLGAAGHYEAPIDPLHGMDRFVFADPHPNQRQRSCTVMAEVTLNGAAWSQAIDASAYALARERLDPSDPLLWISLGPSVGERLVLPRPSNEGKHGLVETGYLMDGRGAPIAR